MQRGALGMERGLDHTASGLGEPDPDHAPVGSASKRPDQAARIQLVDHQRDARLRRLDELGEIPLHAPLGAGGTRLEEQVVLEWAQIMLGEGSVDLDHRLPEAAPEHRRKAQILDGGVLEEVVRPGSRSCLLR